MSVAPTALTVKFKVHFATMRRGRKQIRTGETPVPLPSVARIPRIARVMALAIKFDGMLANGELKDYADIARLGHVTRARVTQMMNLTALAPDIQEALLFLPRTEGGRDAIQESHVRPIAAAIEWRKQRVKWKALQSKLI